jgi:carbon monoxide dehydrogenase subunit G
MGRRFRFTEHWTVGARPEAVHEVLHALEHYPAWWPEVRAVGKVDDDTAVVLCRSALPYTLELVLTAVHRTPALLETRIGGTLDGTVRWRLAPAGPAATRLHFEQEVTVAPGALALAAYAPGPLLRWNHHRMMGSCREGLSSRLT